MFVHGGFDFFFFKLYGQIQMQFVSEGFTFSPDPTLSTLRPLNCVRGKTNEFDQKVDQAHLYLHIHNLGM